MQREPIDSLDDLIDPFIMSFRLYFYTWLIVVLTLILYPSFLAIGLYGVLLPEHAEWLFLESTNQTDHMTTGNPIVNFFIGE